MDKPKIMEKQNKKSLLGLNSLSLFRYLACANVLYGHLTYHLKYPLPSFIGDILSLFPGVPIFFFLSGFLIWNSIYRTPDFKKYLTKRIFRIYPELWICVIIEMLAIFFTYDRHIPWTTYLTFGITQGTLFQFWTPEVLRGWGVGVPNGSLWTITVIVQFYVLVWLVRRFFYRLSLLNSSLMFVLLCIVGCLSVYYIGGVGLLQGCLRIHVYHIYGFFIWAY